MNIPKLNLWDCHIRRFDGWTLEIIGGISSSLENAPTQILRFTGVSYFECPTDFHHPQIRVATGQERKRLAKREAIEPEQTALVITAESAGDTDPQDFYIVAEGFAAEDVSEQSDGGDS